MSIRFLEYSFSRNAPAKQLPHNTNVMTNVNELKMIFVLNSASLEAVTAPTTNTGNLLSPRQWLESDDENNDFEADWSSNVSPDVLQTLSVAEKKRQEVINGK